MTLSETAFRLWLLCDLVGLITIAGLAWYIIAKLHVLSHDAWIKQQDREWPFP